ncbi:centromere protein L-like [Oculina patagonica]
MAELSTPSEANFTGRGKFTRFSSRTGKSSKSARTPWLSRRHTPYVKTPKTGRTSRSQPETVEVSENIRSRKATSEIDRSASTPKSSERSTSAVSLTGRNNEQAKDPVQEIVGKTLRVYQTSPLYNFDRTASALKTFGEQLSAHLQLDTEKQLLIEEDGDFKDRKFRTNVSVFKDLSAEGSKFSAVKIIVHSFDTSKPTKTKSSSPILTTIFCSVGNEEDDRRLQDHFTCLPICLINGPVNLARSLISWFESKFDCRITPMTFSSVDLGWYFSLWAGMSSPGKSTPVELCYDASSVNGLSRILFSIDGKDAKDLWESVHSNNSLIFTEEESTTFLNALQSHFYHHFRINLEGLPLTRVRTAIAYIASEGKLKIVHPRYTDHILEQLTRAALTKEFYGRL